MVPPSPSRRTRNAEEIPGLRTRNGKLYRMFCILDFQETLAEGQWKECVAKDRCPEILQVNHDEATAGHLGIAKMIAHVAQHYYWLRMFREIARYVRKCEVCLRHKVAQTRLASLRHRRTPLLGARHPRSSGIFVALEERPHVAFEYPRSLHEVGRDAPLAPRHRLHDRDHWSGNYTGTLTSYYRIMGLS